MKESRLIFVTPNELASYILYKNQFSIDYISKTIDPIDWGPWPIDFWGSVYCKDTIKIHEKNSTLAAPSASGRSQITVT